jgi:septum formation protein
MLILASASPRRRELLAQTGLHFTVEVSEIDETPLLHEAAAAYVQRIAVEKAQTVCALHVNDPSSDEGLVVLAADTAVVLPGEVILGKPRDQADAIRMLTLLSGRTHAVLTGIAAVSVGRYGGSGKIVSDVEITQVTFNLMTQSEIQAYVTTGEPMDKAGAYAIQGYAARWIPRIEGDYFNVVGLPISRVVALLAEVGEASRAGASVSATKER